MDGEWTEYRAFVYSLRKKEEVEQELKFYKVELGLPKPVAVVADDMGAVSDWARTKCERPRVIPMSDSMRKRWRGATIYLDEVTKGSRQQSR